MLNPTMTPQESEAALQNIRMLATSGWQTDEHPSEQMTVADELEHVLFFVTDVLYRAIPPFYEDIESALIRIYGEEGKDVEVPSIVHFGSWVGGDMDGNPNVNAKTIRETLARQRSLILDLYFNECASLAAKLSQSTDRCGFGQGVLDKITEYRGVFPNAYHAVPARHRDMPYRVFLRLVQQRLQNTYDDDVFPYEKVDQLIDDIQLIADSLKQNSSNPVGTGSLWQPISHHVVLTFTISSLSSTMIFRMTSKTTSTGSAGRDERDSKGMRLPLRYRANVAKWNKLNASFVRAYREEAIRMCHPIIFTSQLGACEARREGPFAPEAADDAVNP